MKPRTILGIVILLFISVNYIFEVSSAIDVYPMFVSADMGWAVYIEMFLVTLVHIFAFLFGINYCKETYMNKIYQEKD